MSALLEMRDVQAAYGHAQALFGMGFDVNPGEVVTLLGRNGMGRSTTIKCLFGMLPLKSGSISFGGKSLAVDGVLCVGEHGNYPTNARGQLLYPRRRFFRAISFKRSTSAASSTHRGLARYLATERDCPAKRQARRSDKPLWRARATKSRFWGALTRVLRAPL